MNQGSSVRKATVASARYSSRPRRRWITLFKLPFVYCQYHTRRIARQIKGSFLVWIGRAQWVHAVYPTPRRITCPGCKRPVKRSRKINVGALYYCKVCKINNFVPYRSVKWVPGKAVKK